MIVVFSIHADDACFSVGEYMAQNCDEPMLVVTLCGGVPPNASDEDRLWQEALNVEGDKAYEHLGADHMPFPIVFDGKWNAQSEAQVRLKLADLVDAYVKPSVGASAFLVPVGIHHPDHVRMGPMLLNQLLIKTKARIVLYEDLPYRVMYPEEAAILRDALFARFGRNLEPAAGAGFLTRKLEACAMFESQWSPPEGDAPRCCSAYERAWWVR